MGDDDSDQDDPQTDDSNPDGEGDSVDVGQLLENLWSVAKWLGKTFWAGLKDIADGLGPRSVVGQISNSTGLTLKLVDQHHDHGEWQNRPPDQIAANSAVGFVSHSVTGLVGVSFTGTQGYVTYGCDEVSVTCSWNNPWAGSTSSSIGVSGPDQPKYLGVWRNGHGDTGAEMDYALVVHPTYSAAKTLRSHRVKGVINVLPIAAGKQQSLKRLLNAGHA